MEKIIEKADKSLLDGDEEESYVLYMKYMNLLSKIQKHPDYEKQKQIVTKTLGNNQMVKKRMDKLQIIQESLRRRYEIKYPPEPLAESTRTNADLEVAENQPPPKPDLRETIDSKTLLK